MSLTQIKRPVTSCDKPVIKLVTTTECKDNIADDYYGTGTVIDGSNGVSAFPHIKITNLRGFIKDVPRDIVKQTSFNCKPQKVSSSIVYQIQGADFYPPWKMRELEEQFHAKQIIVDGYPVLFAGGKVFEEVGKFCNPLFRMSVNIQECERRQIYGCQDECAPNCYYFMIPANLVTQNFFNEAGQQVASTFTGLLEWYGSQSNVIEVTEINAALQINCEYFKIFKVVGTGYVPAFLFYDSPSQSNKVYGMTLDCVTPDYSKLCGGIDNRSCGSISLDPPTVYELLCGDMEIEITDIFIVGESCGVAPFPAWEQHTGDTSIVTSGTSRMLNLSVFNPTYTGSAPTSGSWVYEVPVGVLLCTQETGVPPNGTVIEVLLDGVPTLDYTYNPSTQIITFSPCLEAGVEITVNYTTPGVSPTFSNELIANITGSSCLPATMLYFNNASNPDIPLGATLTIDTLGNVKWTGAPTSADGSGTVIEFENILYTV